MKKERKLLSDFWQAKWENDDISRFDQKYPNVYLKKYLPLFNLTDNSKCVLPLCAKSVDMLYLASLGFDVIGIEISQKAIELFFRAYQIPYDFMTMDNVKVFYSKESSYKITIINADLFDVRLEYFADKIELWYDRSSYIALPSNLRVDYAKYTQKNSQLIRNALMVNVSHNLKLKFFPHSITQIEMQANFSHVYDIEKLESDHKKYNYDNHKIEYNIDVYKLAPLN